ncbi:MAG TPA: DoxX family protein [Ktedonobacteraceae bacterium]
MMNIVLWVVQILLALAFAMAGIMKATQPFEKLSERMKWAKDVGLPGVRLIGVLEILGAIGLILPAITGILPWLTPVAAIGLVLTMIGAMITHGRRGEFPNMGFNLVLLLLAVFIVYGRFVAAPL